MGKDRVHDLRDVVNEYGLALAGWSTLERRLDIRGPPRAWYRALNKELCDNAGNDPEMLLDAEASTSESQEERLEDPRQRRHEAAALLAAVERLTVAENEPTQPAGETPPDHVQASSSDAQKDGEMEQEKDVYKQTINTIRKEYRKAEEKIIKEQQAKVDRCFQEFETDSKSVVKAYQDTVFAIPELLSLITAHFDKRDLRALIQVCRAWNAFWVPYLYSNLYLNKYKRSRVYPKLRTYGVHVKALKLHSTKWNNIIHLLDHTPNLNSLDVYRGTLSLVQFEEMLGMVPRLRSLSLTFYETACEPHGWPRVLTSALPGLEEFSWKGDSTFESGTNKIRIDDILHVLRSCTQLRSLRLAHLYMVEELCPTQPQENLMEQERPAPVKVEDEGWQSRSLQLLECDFVHWGPRPDSQGASELVHPFVRRLFQHAPNLKIVKFTGASNLGPSDWATVFKSGASLEHVELKPFGGPTRADVMNLKDALTVLSTCSKNLKVLYTRYAHGTTDQHFAPLIRANRQLQRLCVKTTGFGDTSLRELVPVPSALSTACRVSQHRIVELDLEGCHQVTAAGVLLVLENCRFLQDLNLAGTRAGTMELFSGSRPWACAKSLETLQIDIQPMGFQAPSVNRAWPTRNSTPHASDYSPVEQQLINDRLCSLTNLTQLELKGENMDHGIFNDASFAPRLRKAIIGQPFTSEGDQSLSFYNRQAQLRAVEIGHKMFPGWRLSTSMRYHGMKLHCILNALRDDP
ncbi:hypothetical protein BGZ68_010637 [Mortierella alpina]|nr:hypothetical protein BGZ68_010637 [Mortierella alpina]